MENLITRNELLEHFTEDQLITYPEEAIEHVTDRTARNILRSTGLPSWPVIGFEFSATPTEGPHLVRDWENLNQYLEGDSHLLPADADDWLVLATYFPFVDHLLLDPRVGGVHQVRHGTDEFCRTNTDLSSYARFLLCLKREAPMDPDNDFEDFFDLDTEAVRHRLQEQWKEIDPCALGFRSSLWYELLLVMHFPEAYHGSSAVEFPYPFFEESLINSCTNGQGPDQG
ncbi:SUKH-4 family immunity protein [Streptomyces sp. XM4193]|uniref:SUKH-4 family immunity protein n=1 Tax=Streptomyces sp. XM4193 TaxID=2929782 RepID=UPI001FF855FA|nr:SUKH-4 family immunity protein [Streptomyces sp. XM4193]MCK1797040.1 SUKH-4 family immunity protein [Streptomyces sp. XM4193]